METKTKPMVESKSYHIDFALRHFNMQTDKTLTEMFENKYSAEEIRSILKRLKKAGYKVWPSGCDNSGPDGTCQGHKK